MPRALTYNRTLCGMCATIPGRDSRQAEQLQKADDPEQPLTGAEKKLVAELCARMDARHRAPRVKLDHRPPKPVDIATADGEPQTSEAARLAAFGTTSSDFYSRTLQELLEAGCRGTQSQPFTEVDLNGALAAMHGIARATRSRACSQRKWSLYIRRRCVVCVSSRAQRRSCSRIRTEISRLSSCGPTRCRWRHCNATAAMP